MIRVLHVVGSMDRGGIETFIMNMYRVIDRSKLQFDFLVNEKENAYSKEINSLGGNIYFIPPRNKGFVAYRKNIDKFFIENQGKFKVIHQHVSSLSSIYPLEAAKKSGIELRIIHSHSSSMKGNKLHYLLHFYNKHKVKKIANKYYACSDKARHWLFNKTGCFSKSEIINNGIKVDDFAFNQKAREKSRKSLNIDENKIAICHIGSFMKVKNHTFLLDIFKELNKISNKYHLYLVGDGELKESIVLKIKELSLNNKITLLGVRGDINTLMQGFDGLVFPSFFEGLPLTLIEAQTSSLPVFCSNTVSKMVKITNHLEFISLKKSAKEWAEIIDLKLKEYKRSDNKTKIINAGYDIIEIAHRLQEVYLNGLYLEHDDR
ncbi:MAG: glycosyltransferase family 1 protein [Tissierellia bacterium]|nr:glycosyltransferase family 1 protein [Tissierellia bacterium]